MHSIRYNQQVLPAFLFPDAVSKQTFKKFDPIEKVVVRFLSNFIFLDLEKVSVCMTLYIST